MEKLSEVETCWDQRFDGRLIYHACAHNLDHTEDPLYCITVEFFPEARRHYSDAGCRQLIARMVGAQTNSPL